LFGILYAMVVRFGTVGRFLKVLKSKIKELE